MSKSTNSQIKSLLETLNDWKGSKISIKKEEKNDIDKNMLSLEDVSIVHQTDDEDDYVDPYTIQLKGKGTVINHAGTSLLPLHSYELPINELLSIEASNEFLTIRTDRATYILKNQ